MSTNQEQVRSLRLLCSLTSEIFTFKFAPDIPDRQGLEGEPCLLRFRARTCCGIPLFVSPVRGNAMLGDEVHFVGPDLNFHGLSIGQLNNSVQRLVTIWLWRANVVFEPIFHFRP